MRSELLRLARLSDLHWILGPGDVTAGPRIVEGMPAHRMGEHRAARGKPVVIQSFLRPATGKRLRCLGDRNSHSLARDRRCRWQPKTRRWRISAMSDRLLYYAGPSIRLGEPRGRCVRKGRHVVRSSMKMRVPLSPRTVRDLHLRGCPVG
jgi:hypothetical protein